MISSPSTERINAHLYQWLFFFLVISIVYKSYQIFMCACLFIGVICFLLEKFCFSLSSSSSSCARKINLILSVSMEFLLYLNKKNYLKERKRHFEFYLLRSIITRGLFFRCVDQKNQSFLYMLTKSSSTAFPHAWSTSFGEIRTGL